MSGRLDARSLEALIRRGDVDTVLTVFSDGYGRLMGKRIVGRHFLDSVAGHGVHACIYLFTVDMEMEPLPGFKLTSWERGYGDMKMVPDLSTARLIPWLPKTALVFCDVWSEDGEPIEEAPRWILRRQIERAAKLGYLVKTAAELELYCFRESYDEARAKRYQGLTPVSGYLEDYHILQTSKEEPLIRAIRNGMEAADVPVETSKGEWGRGQEEINLVYAEALEMADRASLYKHGAKEIAHLQGVSLTFMAKYDAGAAGSSFHVHSSVWDRHGRRALFAPRGGAHRKGAGGPLFGAWLAGQLALARELAYFYAPTVNSYKRYQAGSFAPTRIVAGWDNRTCGFRLCGEGDGLRVENRIPGADANPYLAFAATIAAGLHGIGARLKAPRLHEGNAYEDATLPQVPKTLREAVGELERSKLARAAFGDRVVEHYLHAARLEQQAYDAAVTDWELKRNFERI
ncbi:MAG: glutamine synthetase [Candidatus Rokubacteria bacterium]|nr:glutamine synthetase [Candidatus Rokubacteria bacterium]MBI3826178.1 glutamine synthetase [Candidatus Rokubacteria bacterium]